MSWGRIDDGLHAHGKMLALQSLPEWERALALWTLALSWCSKHAPTTGTIGRVALARLSPAGACEVEVAAGALVDVGLWVVDGEGWRFHDWADYRPPEDKQRARWREQKRQQRAHVRRTSSGQAADIPPDKRAMSAGQASNVRRTSEQCPPEVPGLSGQNSRTLAGHQLDQRARDLPESRIPKEEREQPRAHGEQSMGNDRYSRLFSCWDEHGRRVLGKKWRSPGVVSGRAQVLACLRDPLLEGVTDEQVEHGLAMLAAEAMGRGTGQWLRAAWSAKNMVRAMAIPDEAEASRGGAAEPARDLTRGYAPPADFTNEPSGYGEI